MLRTAGQIADPQVRHSDRIGVKVGMTTLDQLRVEKRDAILRLATLHGCRNVRVFDSLATGKKGQASDVDFLVDLDEGLNLFELGGLLADRKDELQRDVDVVETRCIHPYIRQRVLREAVLL